MRHIYFPCLRAGMSKTIASGVCFLLSALFHELLVSVPFHMVRFKASVTGVIEGDAANTGILSSAGFVEWHCIQSEASCLTGIPLFAA